ncbi:MAG: amidohydrolase family protein [Thiohalocapsa sp. PB-PSB1]|jgi:predicted amidohydrolase YtcJ|nr:MAG: amidohydrolase family protein [Thiohalocapsa sp. PB-PSB1]
MKSIYMTACVVAVAVLIGCDQQSVDEAADMVYTNGRISTVNKAQPWADAEAIQDGKFIAVDSNADIKAMAGDGTKAIDLNGRFVMPGLHDIHLHIQNAYTADALEGELLFIPSGITVVIHAIGDATIRQFINAVARVKAEKGQLDGRHIVSHALLFHPDDMARAAELGITIEFSPVSWYPSDLAEAQRAALGDERMKRWAPIKSAVDAGIRIALASDGPIAWHDPLVALEAAVTRRAQGGHGEPLAPDQAIDVATAVEAYTLGSAYLTGQDAKTGSIEVGKFADMVVLDQNLFEIEPTKIGATKVLKTVLDGRVVFEASNDPIGEAAIESSFDVDLDFGSEGGGTQHGRWHAFCTCSKSPGWVGNSPPFGRISSFMARKGIMSYGTQPGGEFP